MIPTRTPCRRWTPEETAQLRDAVSRPELAARLGRSLDALRLRAQRAHLVTPAPPRWSADHDAQLVAAWPPTNRRALCHALGRSWFAVRQHAHSLGLPRAPHAYRWSADDDAQLVAWWATLDRAALVLHLGRTWIAVRQRARVLQLQSARGRLSL